MIMRDVQKFQHPLAYSQPDFTKQSPEMWAAKLKKRVIFLTPSHISNIPWNKPQLAAGAGQTYCETLYAIAKHCLG